MSALLFGLQAGLGFSPHTMSMVLRTLLGGRRSGLTFMLSGIGFDLILVAGAFLLKDTFSMGEEIKKSMSIIAGLALIRMGYQAFRAKPVMKAQGPSSVHLREGFILQAFNPNPYIFWFLIGVPYMLSLDLWQALQFALTFLAVTYGIKVLIIESCARAASLSVFNDRRLTRLRKSVSVLTLLNGIYLLVSGLYLA